MNALEGIALAGNRKHAAKIAVYEAWKARDLLLPKEQAYEMIGRLNGVSASTVKRYVDEIGRYGYTPRSKRKQGRGLYAWDVEAIEYFRAFYLAAIREVGACTVRNAYRETVSKAQDMGWRIGSEPSAYTHARDINPAVIRYANGGNRALDNMFYIARDLSKLRPFQAIVGDQHRFDFWVQDIDGTFYRPECYLWLDMRTRLVYGIAFDRNYSARTVLRALRMGVKLYGKFECTYNDNGSSEKSALADCVIEQLLMYGMRFQDEAEAYNSGNGYVVEDEYGTTLDIVPSRAEWQRRHRRVFAAVKNAKTKPIERFFSSLEQLLRDLCLPGYIKEVGMSAAEEEEATRRLNWQKGNGYILSIEEFAAKVMQAISLYHKRDHGTLGRSPETELDYAITHEGFSAQRIPEADVKYLFLESTTAKVRGDRVQFMGRQFIGPDLTRDMIRQNRGNLVSLDKKVVELRFDPDEVESGGGIWAIDPRDKQSIYLTQVELVEMFDDDAAARALEKKRTNMRAVRSSYHEFAAPAIPGTLISDPGKHRELETSERLSIESAKENAPVAEVDDRTDEQFSVAVSSLITSEPAVRSANRTVYKTPRARYEAILLSLLRGDRISDIDSDFKCEYESSMDDQESQYWDTFIRFNQGGCA